MKKTAAKKEEPGTLPPPSDKQAYAVTRYLRISPRKARLVIDTVRYKPTVSAFRILMSQKRKAARMTEKLLKSAVANAKVLGLDESRLYISEIRADGGPTFKRFRPRSMGRADRILKRTTHLSLKVKEGNKQWTKPSSAVAEKAEVKGAPKAGKGLAAPKTKKKAAAAAK